MIESDKGWECPKCGRCYAPTVGRCMYCGPDEGRTVPRPYWPNFDTTDGSWPDFDWSKDKAP